MVKTNLLLFLGSTGKQFYLHFPPREEKVLVGIEPFTSSQEEILELHIFDSLTLGEIVSFRPDLRSVFVNYFCWPCDVLLLQSTGIC